MIFDGLARWYVHADDADNVFREETRTYYRQLKPAFSKAVTRNFSFRSN